MKYLFYIIFILSIIGCSSKVIVPKQKIASAESSLSLDELFYESKTDVILDSNLQKNISYPKSGELNSYNILINDELEAVYSGYLSGNTELAFKNIDKILKKYKNPKILWQTSMLKMKLYITLGLGDDAVDEYQRCQQYEKLAFNSNLNCKAMRAESYVWSGNFKSAKLDLASILDVIGDWTIPVKYNLPPSNMVELVSVTTAQLRAYTSLSAIYTLQENYKQAYKWAKEADKRFNSIIYISNHWLYGKFVKLHLDTYYGKATNLTFLASAQLILGDEKSANKNFQKAKSFFNAIGYKKGVATVLAMRARALNVLGKYTDAYEAVNIALNYSLKYNFLDFIWRIEAIKAETLELLNLPDEAQKAYRKANDVINSLSNSLTSDSSKRKFGFNKDDITFSLLKYDKLDKKL